LSNVHEFAGFWAPYGKGRLAEPPREFATGTTALPLRVVGLIQKTNTGDPIFLAHSVEKLAN
jgi:hypothetical protein